MLLSIVIPVYRVEAYIGQAPAAFRPAGLLLVCLGVAAVCGITAVLLFRMRKKNH